jgi:hypothetical protein
MLEGSHKCKHMPIKKCLHCIFRRDLMQAQFIKRMLAMSTEAVRKQPNRAKGGLARKEKLSPEMRSEIARKAAIARHSSNRQLEATHKGNFLERFGVDVECYVLNDAGKTAVLTQRGMSAALGFSNPGGNDFVRFIGTKAISKYLGDEAGEKIHQPIEFKGLLRGGAENVRGYSADVLIDVCNAILSAEAAGDLTKNQANLIKQARVLLNASAKSGIQNLVYALAGYRPEAEEVIQAFRAFVQAEAKKYEAEFPSELYVEWARLYGHRPQRSWKDMHLTINHVYYPLAKSDGHLLALLREAKASAGDRNAKLFQFLNLVGARALRFQLGRVYDVAQGAASREAYEDAIAKRFGGQQLLISSNA